MRYLSVCSGIEAATVAWHPLGWTPEAYSEIEKFPAAVLAHHYPQTPNLGDMTNYKEWNIGDIDLLVGGTPCQSFSVAGLRKGLDDPRGNLALVYLGIAERFHPRWLLWENVPGVLSSSGGRDFGSFLGAMAQLGYGFAYRVLDAQYFGVPQRRRRVFVVGHLGDWRRAAAVLFEQHSLQGHPAPSRKKGEEAARNVAIGIDEECNATINGTGPLLRGGQGGTRNAVACFQKNTRDEVRYLGGDGQIAGALAASSGMKQTNYICAPVSPTLRAGGNKTGGDRPPGTDVDTADSLIVTPCHTTGAGFWKEGYGTLRGREQDSHENLICMSTGQASAEIGIGIGPTLNCNHEAPIVCHGTQDPCVSGIAFAQGRNSGGENVLCFQSSQSGIREVLTHATLDANNGSRRHNGGIQGVQVRRLTPTECESLQGFPRGYTNIPWRKKPEAPDGPRYKALGNSMAVPVMRWIGERIQMVDEI
jgi:DNA (cytosine-5)-methyltransferase 1